MHICLRYPPATGGVETYVKEIVERTRDIEAKKDVRVLTSKMRTHGPISELDPNLLLDDPIYVQRLFHAKTPLVSYPRLQALKYYIGHHKPDIIHAYSFWYQPADVAARYARKNNIPFFFHPVFYENNIRKKLHWQLYKHTIGKRTFQAADVVIVISPFERNLIKKSGLPVRRFAIIPPGVNVEQLQREQDNPFAQRGIKGRVLLMVSRLSKEKGLEDVVRAMPSILREHPDVQLAVVGEDFGHKKQLHKIVKSVGLEERVHFLGKLSRKELIGAYQHATLFTHPSHYEAFGIVLVESLAAGTPVIARNTTAIPHVVPDKKAGILFSSQKELVQSIIDLLTDDTKYHDFSAYGKQHILDNFTWDVSIKKLTALYREYGH